GTSLSTLGSTSTGIDDLKLVQEPPESVVFTNSSGAAVNCVADGASTPTIRWTTADGRTLHEVPGLLNVLTNGTLEFPAFPAQRYDTRLHDATYVCTALGPGGALRARPTHIRAVVVGDYEVQVYDQLVMSGNTAVLRCSVPSYVREYVQVTSWVRDDNFNIYPTLHGDGKYHMLEGGDLHVLDVGPQDGHSRFHCRSRHIL
ncbi:unnamed protein product, partial [Meganyctiphanes norvegica]